MQKLRPYRILVQALVVCGIYRILDSFGTEPIPPAEFRLPDGG